MLPGTTTDSSTSPSIQRWPRAERSQDPLRHRRAALPAALDEVIYETEVCPFAPSDSTEGLLLATEAGLYDATLPIAEIACIYSSSHVRSLLHAHDVIGRSTEALAHVERLAQNRYIPLVLAAQLRLPDTSKLVAERAANITARFLRDELEPEEIVTYYDRGLLAQWASGEDQAAVARQLIAVIGTPGDFDAQRHQSADGLAALAPALAPECASELGGGAATPGGLHRP